MGTKTKSPAGPMKPEQIAKKILPHLVRAAMKGKLTNYGKLAKAVSEDMAPLAMAPALGHIRDCWWPHLPMINALCVNQSKGKPGRSWHRDRVFLKSEAFKEAEEWARAVREVWNRRDWDKQLADLKKRGWK